MIIKYQIEGLKELERKLSPTEFKTVMKQGMTSAIVYFEGELKENTPVLSGQLRAAWTHRITNDGLVGEVGNSKGYGLYVEFGTGVYIGNGRIYPRVKKAMAWGDGAMVRRSIAGMRGRFFVRKTWETKGGEKLLRFFKIEVDKQLQRG